MNTIIYPDQELRLDSLTSIYKFHTIIDVLRLDLIHPVISGNKWFKLIRYLKEAQNLKKSAIITFGGAYSNHIVATAAACKLFGLRSYGIIRGEKPAQLSPTLQDALGFGMKLIFVDRNTYREKAIPQDLYKSELEKDLYIINEGGYGEKGALGIKDMLQNLSLDKYTAIVCAVGTGTTLAGIVNSVTHKQKCIGISVMKNNMELDIEVNKLLSPDKKGNFNLYHEYHFGGYAKYNQELIDFMNRFYSQTLIPLDFVYTAKSFYAMNDLIEKETISKSEKILMIHTGGLQGNRSLKEGTLIFS